MASLFDLWTIIAPISFWDETDGLWQCMDTYREMEMLNHLDDTGQARWKIW